MSEIGLDLSKIAEAEEVKNNQLALAEANKPTHLAGAEVSPKIAAETAADTATDQIVEQPWGGSNQGTSGRENLRNDVRKVGKVVRGVGKVVGGMFRRKPAHPETQFTNHGDSGASETTTTQDQQQEQSQLRESNLLQTVGAQTQELAGTTPNTLATQPGTEIAQKAGQLAHTEQRDIAVQRGLEPTGPEVGKNTYTTLEPNSLPASTESALPPAPGAIEGTFRELPTGEQSALAGPETPNDPFAQARAAAEQAIGAPASGGTAVEAPGVPSWTGNEADDDILRGATTGENQSSSDDHDLLRSQYSGAETPNNDDDLLRSQFPGTDGENPEGIPIDAQIPQPPAEEDDLLRSQYSNAGERPNPDDDLLRSQFPGPEGNAPDGTTPPTGPEAPTTGATGTTETGTPPTPDGENIPNPDNAAREREDAEILRLQQDLALKREAYIKARAVTRSFWRNLVGNIVSFGTAEINSPMAHREAMRKEYENARNALIKLQAEAGAKRNGFSVPEMPADLAIDASEDEKTEHAEKTAKAKSDREKYDKEVLANAINLITAEKHELAKVDFENMSRSSAVRQALERLAKNPTVRLAVTGGLLASTATGFLPGIAAFGAAQAGLGVVGMKGALDFGAEQYAAKFGDERKNLSTEQLMKMDQGERDRREAALLEMGIKRNKDSVESEQKIDAMSQERTKVAVQRMMEQGKIEGNTPQERAVSVLAAMLKEGNLNGAIDSKIDKNRRWNAVRWTTALAGTAVMSGWIDIPGVSADVQPDTTVATPDIAPTPTIETTNVVPWEHASGHGYSWTGWQEGQIRDFLNMSPDFQGETDIQNWINTHPTEYSHAKNAIIEAMQQANPGVDVANQGVLGQEYKIPTNLRTVIEQAIRSGSNVS